MRFFLLAAAAASLLAAPASAQDRATAGDIEQRRVIRLGTPYTTSISGSAGAYSRTLTGSAPSSILVGMGFTETRDTPCYAEASFRSWHHGRPRGSSQATDVCGKTYNDQQGVTVSGAVQRVGIRALRLGMNGKGNKMKAVAIRGVTLDQDEMGEVRPDSGLDDHFDRPNFREPWKNWVSCAGNEVAVGVVVHYNNRESITGLALRCASVEISRVVYQAGTDRPYAP